MKPSYLTLLGCCVIFVAASRPSRTDLWKHGLSGPVLSCKTVCYQYTDQPDGTKTLQRSPLHYAGNAYDVDSHYFYDAGGNIAEEKTIPYEEGVFPVKRVYERDSKGQITRVQVLGTSLDRKNTETLKYEYDKSGRLKAIARYNDADKLIDVQQTYLYNNAGYQVINWEEDGIEYTSYLNKDGKCMEEVGVLPSGKEFFHNYHQYDNKSGKRTRTTFTVDKKIIEVRDNPSSDNVLEDGRIVSTDTLGNWITMIFDAGDGTGAMVIREIMYYPLAAD